MADHWYYRMLGTDFGPVSREVLDELIHSGQLGPGDEVRRGEAGSWTQVNHLAKDPEQPVVQTGSVFSLSDFGMKSLEDAGPATAAIEKVDRWYYQALGQEWGPVTWNELLLEAESGRLGPDDQVRIGTQGRWRRAGSVGRIMAAMPFVPKSTVIVPGKPKPAQPASANNGAPTSAPSVAAPPVAAPSPAAPAPSPPPPGVDQAWYAWIGGVEYGPMNATQLMHAAQAGRIAATDYVKQGRMSQWVVASRIQGLIPQPAP